MLRTHKYRIYPTKSQEQTMINNLFLCRQLYNTALEQRISAYKTKQQTINYNKQANELPLIKNQFPEYNQIHSQILQDSLKRIDNAYKLFFERLKVNKVKAGFPRFKSANKYHSFTYTQSGFRINKDKKRIELSKIGKIKIKYHRDIPINATIKTCTIKKSVNHWYTTITFELPDIKKAKKTISNAVAIDLGLTTYAYLSNGKKIKNPKYLIKSESKLKELQSKYSKSKRSKTKRQKLAKLYRKVSNQRTDFQHKLSRQLVNTYDAIFYEDLNIKSMIQDNTYKLNKYISDASWGKFIAMIKYKAEEEATYAIAVNPRGTSQTCSNCGTIVKKDLYVRVHKCHNCNISLNRDYNASLNILRLGTNLLNIQRSQY